MAHYEIRDDLPMPPPRTGSTAAPGPHAMLQPGQGFTVPLSDFRRAQNAAFNWGKKHGGIRFTCRKIDAETGGIWRVK